MEGWKETYIKDEFYLGRGRVISQVEIEKNLGIYPVYSSQSTNKGEMGKISTFDFEGEYITWTTDGAYAGTVFYREGKFNCTNVCGTLKAIDETKISHNFVAYLLSTLAKNYVSYVGNPKLMNGVMALIPICIPETLTEQRQIAEILTTLDDAIQQTEHVIAKQKKIKAGLMRDLLTYGIDQNGTIRSPRTHSFIEKNGLIVPEEWEVIPLNEIANITGGKRLPKGSSYSTTLTGYKYLRVTDFYQKQINYNHLENISKEIYDILARYEILKNDLFISIAGSIGYVGILKPTDEDVYILTENALRIAVIKDNVNNDFLCLTLNSVCIQNQIWSEIGTGGGVPKLAMHRVKSLNIPIPNSSNEQQHIVSILEAQDELITAEENKLSKLLKTKQGLMHDLLTGKVRLIL